MADPGNRMPEVILVADDIPANVELLLDQLNSLGYDTITAVDGPSAVAAAFEQHPDLCILDVSMPAGDLGVDDRSTGFEVCRRIKRDPRTARIPVIFVTALNDTSDRVRGIEAGGDDFLTKPHNRLVLGARVRSLLKLKAATDALEDSLRKLRELERVRDDLMKMIVHDLKTPLTSVLATLEMLSDGDFGQVTTPQKVAIGDVESKSEDLLALIDDILEVARIEETNITLALAPMAPGALLAELVHEWGHRFQQEKTTVSVSVADDAPVFTGDKGLIKRVFSNLIQSDNGPGIPPEYHEVIFRKFGQVEMPRTPRTRSSGLGLTFCKLVVERHRGRIWVKSAEGKGSSFYIELPVDPAAMDALQNAASPTAVNGVGR